MSNQFKTYNDLQPHYTASFWGKAVVSMVCGALTGGIIAVIVNCTLFEITLNAFFSTYFSALFIAIGSTILWRIRDGKKSKEIQNGTGAGTVADGQGGLAITHQTRLQEENDKRRRRHLRMFSYVTVASGIICFFFDKSWYDYSRFIKIPIYSMLGISVSLALTFTVIDAVNFLAGICQGNTMARPIIESPNQIHVVLTLAVIMGAIFGFIFGNFRLPANASLFDMRLQMRESEQSCYHYAGFLGSIGGLINEYLRHIEVHYYSAVAVDFDDDI